MTDASVEAASDTYVPPVDAGQDACVPMLLVNELQTGGALGPSDEFVEIYNAGTCDVSLANWSLEYSSASGSPANVIWTGQPADAIAAGGYAVIGGVQFNESVVIGRFNSMDLAGMLGKGGGGVGLFAPAAPAPTDAMAYATLTTGTNPFLRPATLADGGPPSPAPNPPLSQSVARTPNGANSGANASDFAVAVKPTPGKAN